MIKHPAYSKEELAEAIRLEQVKVTPRAWRDARKWFKWTSRDICDAILELPQAACHKTVKQFDNPEILLDMYRAEDINGENIFTHLYMENGWLVVDSFKELYI